MKLCVLLWNQCSKLTKMDDHVLQCERKRPRFPSVTTLLYTTLYFVQSKLCLFLHPNILPFFPGYYDYQQLHVYLICPPKRLRWHLRLSSLFYPHNNPMAYVGVKDTDLPHWRLCDKSENLNGISLSQNINFKHSLSPWLCWLPILYFSQLCDHVPLRTKQRKKTIMGIIITHNAEPVWNFFSDHQEKNKTWKMRRRQRLAAPNVKAEYK